MNDRIKCDETDVCKTLESKLSDPYTNSKGFRAVHTMNIASGATRFLGVVFKTSAKDRGLLMNYCPWCGGKPGYFERC